MRVTFLLSLIREDIVRALLWTLVHSLWQGLALAILTGMAILFTRRSSPVWRYNILVGILCLFIAGAGATFFLLLGTPAAGTGMSGNPAAFHPGDASGAALTGVLYTGNESFWGERLTVFFNQRANIIVTVWFVILAIRLVKLVADLWTVRCLRHYRTSQPSADWRARVVELAHRIGIKRAVTLLESSLVKTPMMAGVLKPVILMPLGLLAKLPPQEVEAILLHELAHIRRKDYLANLVQCFVEVIFFFNPAIWWISSLIREERENCCDDIALGETSSKKDLINALVSFQEYRHSNYTLAFAGSKDHLFRRVRRIIQRDDKTLDKREKFILLACLFITAGLTLAYTRQAPASLKTSKVEMIWQAPPVEDVNLKEEVIVADTSKKPPPAKDSVSTQKDREWRQALEEQKAELELQQLRLNQERARLEDKQKELELQQVQLKLQYQKASKDTLTHLQQDYLDKLRLDGSQAREDRMSRQREEIAALKERQLREKERTREALARLRAMRDAEEEQRQLEEVQRLREDQLRAQEDQQKVLEKQQGVLEERHRELFSSERARRTNHSRETIIQPVLNRLLDSKLVEQTDDISFSLNNEAFIVNDKKQPQSVFESFRDAYIHGSDDYIKFSRHKGEESSSIKIDK